MNDQEHYSLILKWEAQAKREEEAGFVFFQRILAEGRLLLPVKHWGKEMPPMVWSRLLNWVRATTQDCTNCFLIFFKEDTRSSNLAYEASAVVKKRNILRSTINDGMPALQNLIVSYLVPKAPVRRLLRVLSAYDKLKPDATDDEWDHANSRGIILGEEWDAEYSIALHNRKTSIRAV